MTKRAEPRPHLACVAWILAFFCFMHSCFSHVLLILIYKRIPAFMGQIFTAWSIGSWAHFISSYPSCSAANLFWVLSFSHAIWAMLDPNLLFLKDVSHKGHISGSIPYSRDGISSSSPIFSTVSCFLLYLSLSLSASLGFHFLLFWAWPIDLSYFRLSC